MTVYVQGSYPWPFDGRLAADNTALLVIDMVADYCAKGGWLDQIGVDLTPLRRPLEPLSQVLAAMREKGYPVLFVRESYRPDLSDLNGTKQWRAGQRGIGIGEQGRNGRVLIRGEPGCEIVHELSPIPGEPVIDKPGMNAFYASELDQILRRQNIRNLIIGGVTTDGSVQSSLRDANDRGYECLLLRDCCAAADPSDHEATIEVLGILNGLYGSICPSNALLTAIA